MKKKKGFKLKKICSEAVLLPQGIENIDFNKMINFNETGEFLWNAVDDEEFTEEYLVKLLLSKYEVEHDIAVKDVHDFCNSMLELGVFLP